ncbi:MAG TPA: ABC transporter permease [Acidimicrobiales bacterium]|nr:ABC transporter permease [Acidimicrobiales bacterium]
MLVVQAGISGLFTGAGYALIAVTITLMYRSTGVLSFAHAAFAAVSAYLYIDLVEDGIAKPLAAALAVTAATAYGLVVERVVIRPVRHADAATRLIATLGVLTFTSGVLLWHYGFSPLTAELLLPAGSVTIADVAVSYQKLAVFGVAAVSSVTLAWFLGRTRFGTAVRAVAEDPEAARLHGVSLATVARFNWGLGAALAGVIAVLMAPLQSVNVGTFTLLLAKALTATLVGGLSSLTLTFAGGLLVGVIENIAVVRSTIPGAPQALVMVLVVVVLVGRRRWPAAPQSVSSSAAPARHARSSTLAAARARLRPLLAPLVVAGLAVAVVVPARSTYWSFVGGRALFFVIETLSLVLLVGWGGQVNLMQGAYVGIGAFGTAWLVVEHDLPLAAALLLASLAGTVLGALVGLPALRLSGLLFAAGSLAFATAASAWLFVWGELPRSMPRGDLLGIDLSSDIAVYFLMLAVTAAVYLAAWNLRRSTQGTLLIAARDASSTVAHFGSSPARARLGAFLLASFVATLGGGLYVILVTGLSAADFSPFLSLTLLVYFVVGGSQSLLGPVLAGIAFGIIPQLVQSEVGTKANAVPGIIAGAAVVVLLATRPGGLASLIEPSSVAPADGAAPAPAGPYADVRRRLAAVAPPPARAVTAWARSRPRPALRR